MSTANELLRRALEAYDHKEEPYFERLHHAFEDIRAYLATEPEAKPTQFVRLSEEEVTEILTSAYDMYSTICAVENRLVEKNNPPKPEPARKPMTAEEMREAWNDPEELTQQCLIDYCRAIEKHHGIGGDDA